MNRNKIIEKFLDFTGAAALIFFWAYTYYLISAFPEIIPTHFNLAGEPDSFGSKNTSYLLPAVATIIFILLTVINRNPERFNYPFPVNESNAKHQYRLAANFIRILRLSIVIIFLLILHFTGRSARGVSEFQNMLLPAVLLMTFLPILIYLILASGIKSSKN